MIEIFNGDEYRVYIDDYVMVFRPKTISGNVLLLPPPGVKPQFYSVLAVLLTKLGIGVVMPRRHLPCSQSRLRQVINKLLERGNYDLVVMLGFDLDTISNPRLIIGFSGDNFVKQLVRSNVPGSVHGLLINDCAWVRDSVRNAVFSIDEELPSLSTIVRIRDLVLNTLHLGGVSKNNN
ncbi:hypothetical protein [Vulcanisaeta distributa]|uniref:Uncharacterized protein n=1 Tax=Vulcanisaeta distributa (strain DSM 14429 / JCM 11212 / NBRC 100878 / IC-017) TaxID=572478 RepID=E1QNP7_VULDI|nr:hypothetical protein [Vulcanisaeta distributa]ADN50143.1 hypothetical protein Vdis_0750 [Vulcanisaeta distributa DSM 14429]